MVVRRSPAIWLTTSLWRLSRGRAGVFQWGQGPRSTRAAGGLLSVQRCCQYTAAVVHCGCTSDVTHSYSGIAVYGYLGT